MPVNYLADVITSDCDGKIPVSKRSRMLPGCLNLVSSRQSFVQIETRDRLNNQSGTIRLPLLVWVAMVMLHSVVEVVPTASVGPPHPPHPFASTAGHLPAHPHRGSSRRSHNSRSSRNPSISCRSIGLHGQYGEWLLHLSRKLLDPEQAHRDERRCGVSS
jgi:hypothetical protein